MLARISGYTAAVVFHLALLLLGGLLFPKANPERARQLIEEVDLVAEQDEEEKDKKKEDEPDEKKAEEAEQESMEAPVEQPPDMSELNNMDESAAAVAPALDALSLAALEGLLEPGSAGGSGDFGGAASLTSGGRIGGTGSASAVDATDDLEATFALSELDQRPRPILQTSPVYPHEMRQKKVEGTVYVVFLVDPQGRVLDPRVENSPEPAFEKPALDAVKQWKFEPAVKNGQKVPCKLRVPIRFSAS